MGSTVSLIIPTLNAGRYIKKQLDMLLCQTVPPDEILLVDSGSTDDTLSIANAYQERCPFLRIRRIDGKDFDHGGTRHEAIGQTKGNFVVFLTQDALPKDERCLENLLSPFADVRIAAVSGRQAAYPDADAAETLVRQFNYPMQSRLWSKQDINTLGVKAYFFSDACAAYRRTAYEQAGGFDHPIPTNEDMLMAAKLLHLGWSLGYCAEAVAYHSHHFSLKEEYLRNVRIGAVMSRYRERLQGAASGQEGVRMVKFVLRGLTKQKKYSTIPRFVLSCAARLIGYKIGYSRTKPL